MTSVKLICLPYAGGSAIFFKELAKVLAPNIECVIVEYAGHGKRGKEPFYNSWEEWIEDTAEEIRRRVGEADRIAIFGYSIGSIVGYEVLANDLFPSAPIHCFFASHESPAVEWESQKHYALSDEAFLEALRPKGGFERVDAKVLKNPVFQKVFFAPLRWDYELIHRYHPSRIRKLAMPVTLMYGAMDMTEVQVATWDSLCEKPPEKISFPGNHFFLTENAMQVAQIIRQRIGEVAQK